MSSSLKPSMNPSNSSNSSLCIRHSSLVTYNVVTIIFQNNFDNFEQRPLCRSAI